MTLEKVNKLFAYKSDKSLDSWTGLQSVDGRLVGDCEDYCITLKREVEYFKNWDYYYCKVNGNGHCILSNGIDMIDCNIKQVTLLEHYKQRPSVSNVYKFNWFVVFSKLAVGKLIRWFR